MNILAFSPVQNTGGDHPHDADYFKLELEAFLDAQGSSAPIHQFDNTRKLPARFAQTLAWIGATEPTSIDVFAACCHGWRNGAQFGISLQNVASFAAALKPVAKPVLTVVLYACSTARDNDIDQADDLLPGPGGDGGMADAIRDALLAAGVQATVYAHAKDGDCVMNPWVRRFGPETTKGGEWVIEPHSKLWLAWEHALQGSLRFRFPFMTQAQIEAELGVAAGAVA